MVNFCHFAVFLTFLIADTKSVAVPESPEFYGSFSNYKKYIDGLGTTFNRPTPIGDQSLKWASSVVERPKEHLLKRSGFDGGLSAAENKSKDKYLESMCFIFPDEFCGQNESEY